jgi:hypothetical protein
VTVNGAFGSSAISIVPQLVRRINCFGSFLATVCGGLVFIGVRALAVVALQTIFEGVAA